MWLGNIPIAVVRDGTVYDIHADHPGTPRVITDSTNTEMWRWDSDPFGAAAADEDPDGDGVFFSYNLRFPGQYFDGETGLHYNYFRDYGPSTGRYIQSDPIGLAAGLNIYEYALNNPIRVYDPFGLEPNPACVAACTIGGAIIGGAAGYVGGGALGGAAGGLGGSVVGPGGTIVGGAAGAVTGARAGGAAGAVAGSAVGNAVGQAVCPDDACPPSNSGVVNEIPRWTGG